MSTERLKSRIAETEALLKDVARKAEEGNRMASLEAASLRNHLRELRQLLGRPAAGSGGTRDASPLAAKG